MFIVSLNVVFLFEFTASRLAWGEGLPLQCSYLALLLVETPDLDLQFSADNLKLPGFSPG